MNKVKVTALAKKILWSCNGCYETVVKYPPLKSHQSCPNCRRSMQIDKVVE